MTTDLIEAARAGDGDAFGQLIGPYEPELRALCYRMLGLAQDAEDALQEALLAAWQGLAGFSSSTPPQGMLALSFRSSGNGVAWPPSSPAFSPSRW